MRRMSLTVAVAALVALASVGFVQSQEGPVQIGGNVTGASGTITFTSNRQLQRAALLLENDTIYIAFASYGDQGPYHGWIFAYNATTLQREAIYNTSPNGSGAGIWQAEVG